VAIVTYATYWNGKWVSYSQVKISPKDRGFTGRDLMYDTEGIFNDKRFGPTNG
jgi:branched-subunit amino acid aminotransferase/4-amino-4-deoxychorismate lyase